MNIKKYLSILLTLILLIGLLPVTALAADAVRLVMCYTNTEGYCEEWAPFGSYTESFYPALLIGGALQPIDPVCLYVSDTSALSAAPDAEFEGAVSLMALADYAAEVRYDHSDGRTYSFKVSPVMPTIGVYSKPEAKGAYYLRSFTAREDNNTIYLIVENGYTIEQLSLEHFANDCTYTISSDQRMATITVGPDAVPPAYPYLVISGKDDLGFYADRIHHIDLTTAFPGIYYRSANWSNGSPTEDPTADPHKAWDTIKGSAEACCFYFFDGTEETLLSADRLYSTNEDVVTVSTHPDSDGATQLSATGFGTAAIAYDRNGRTYTLPVSSALPDYGLFTAPVFTEAAYIDSANGVCLAEGDTVYLMLGDGLSNSTIADVSLFEDECSPFPAGSFCTISPNGRSAAITLGEVPKGKAWYTLWFDLYFPRDNAAERFCDSLLVNDAAPAPTPIPTPAENPFTDTAETDWFFAPVQWAVEKGITGGLTPTTFGPNASCTRAQVVTFLYAAAGKPAINAEGSPFDDVSDSDWFYAPVMWAVQNSITGGLTATTFGPNETCTRAQVVTFLYAAAGKPAIDTASNPFTDVSENDWFYKSVMWAVENGITGGLSPTTFGPNETCTRAQVVTFLYANETK